MFGRAYTWLLQGTYSKFWWNKKSPCSKRDLTTALDSAILTDLLPLSTTGQTTVSGIVSILRLIKMVKFTQALRPWMDVHIFVNLYIHC